MFERILEQARRHERGLARFLRDLIAIKSLSSQEGDVIRRIEREMQACGYDEVRIDPMGNILGRIGNGAARPRLRRPRRHGRCRQPGQLDGRSVRGRRARRHHLRPRRLRHEGRARVHRLRRAHHQGTGPRGRLHALGRRQRAGRGLRRPVLAVHHQRRRPEAGGRRHHRADQPRHLPRPPRADGDRGAHAAASRATARPPSAASTRSTRWRRSSPTSSG